MSIFCLRYLSLAIGLAILARTKLNGHVIFGASGGTYGFTTYTATIPDLDISITILTNLGRFDLSRLTSTILGALTK